VKKLSWGGAFLLLVIIAFSVFFLNMNQKIYLQQKKETTDDLQIYTEMLSQRVANQMVERVKDARQIAAVSLEFIHRPRELADILKSFIIKNNSYILIVIIDKNGRLIASNRDEYSGLAIKQSLLQNQDFKNISWFQSIASGKSYDILITHSDPLLVGSLGSVQSAVIATPLLDEKNVVIGAIGVYTDASWLNKLFVSLDELLKNANFHEFDLELQDGNNQKKILNFSSTNNAIPANESLTLFSPVLPKEFQSLGWKTLLTVNKNTVFAELEASRLRSLIVFCFISICFFVGIGILSINLRKTLKKLKAESRLHQQSRLDAEKSNSAKSDFLAVMSHEIRTPINGIIGASALMQEICNSNEQREFTGIINHSARLLLGLVNDILDFSKIEAGKFEIKISKVDLGSVVQEVLAGFKFTAEQKGIRIVYDTDWENKHKVMADSLRIKQILLNLLSNAVKFTDQGQVTLRLKSLEANELRARLRFEVEDQGIGIAPENKDKLFQSFSQVDDKFSRKFGGTGLGLSIAKKLVELLQGEIGFTSELGKGSCFWFELPFDICPEPLSIESPAVTFAANGSDKFSHMHVLITDDNAINRLISEKFLKKMGFRKIDLAENGQIAVTLAQKNDYDLILMDCQMPEMDGYEATQIIRKLNEHYKKAPIIAYTANGTSGDIEKCYQAGMIDVINKPIEPENFAKVVSKWCA